MLLTANKYAEHRKRKGLPGITGAAVRKALRDHRISANARGMIDPKAADTDWERNTQPEKQSRTQNKKTKPYRPLRGSLASITLEREKLKLKKERRLELVAQGKLIDAAEVHAAAFDIGRRGRDALLVWPARITAILAAELEVDSTKLAVLLQKHLRQFLNEQPQLWIQEWSEKVNQ